MPFSTLCCPQAVFLFILAVLLVQVHGQEQHEGGLQAGVYLGQMAFIISDWWLWLH